MSEESAGEFALVRARLKEAEETLRAIRCGEVDAVLVHGPAGDQFFTLKGADEPYRVLIEEMSQGAVTLSPEGAILYCNRRFSDLLKTPVERITGVAFSAFVAAPEQPAFAALLQAGRAGGSAGEITLQASDGSAVPLQLALGRLPADSAAAICLIATDISESRDKERRLRTTMGELVAAQSALAGTNRDLERQIIERLRVEEELRERQEAFRALVENSPDEISRFDREFRHLYINRRPERFIGKTLDESGFPAELVSVWKAHFQKVFDTGRPGVMEYEATAENGTRRFFQSRLVPEFAPAGDVDSVLIVSRDITARRQAEEALCHSEEQTRLIVDTAYDAFIAIDAAGITTNWNTQAEVTFGWSREEAIGRRLSETIIPPQYQEAHERGMKHFHATGHGPVLNKRIEITAMHRDGREFPVELTIWPIKTAETCTFNAFLRDITERKLAEATVQQAKAAAELANRAKTEFLARMSNRLRTPINAILGFAQLMEMGNPAPTQREGLEQILNGGRQLLDLFNEVLDISCIEAGRLSISPEPVRVGSVLDECVQLMRSLADQNKIRLELGARAGCIRQVMADPRRFKQVILSLLSNAVKYNRAGGSVTLSYEESGAGGPPPEGGRHVRIKIADTGRGIAAQDLPQLFDAFQRVAAEQSSAEGTGLGLALSKRLIEGMGGTIGVESTVGEGSVFWVELPMVETLNGRAESIRHRESATDNQPTAAGTVLYIEDNVSSLRLVECVLAKRPGVKLIAAMQGRLGLELAREHLPDLILLDLDLPDIPGEKVLRCLQAEAPTRNLPVVIVSAEATPQSIERVLAAGAHAYLSKPFDITEFLAIVDQALHAGSAAMTGGAS